MSARSTLYLTPEQATTIARLMSFAHGKGHISMYLHSERSVHLIHFSHSPFNNSITIGMVRGGVPEALDRDVPAHLETYPSPLEFFYAYEVVERRRHAPTIFNFAVPAPSVAAAA